MEVVAPVAQELVEAPQMKTSSLWCRRKSGTATTGLQPTCSTQDTKPGSLIGERFDMLGQIYDVLDRLGSGSTSTVFRAVKRSDGRSVALKVVRSSDEEMLGSARREFDLICKLQHPHILQAFDFHDFGMRDVMCLEYFHGRTLLETVAPPGVAARPLPESVACRLGTALFEAVAYLHARRVVHRDLTPTNVLVSFDFNDLRVADFNAACDLGSMPCIDEPLTPLGPSLYAAPEVVIGESPAEESDMWCAGLCWYLLLSGQLPQHRGNLGNTFQRQRLVEAAMQRIALDEPRWQHVSDDCKDMLKRCLELDKAMRPTAEQVLANAYMQAAGGNQSASASNV